MNIDKEELKSKLTEEEYKVTQEKGTEAPFTGAYVHEKSKGMYNCIRYAGQNFFLQTGSLTQELGGLLLILP